MRLRHAQISQWTVMLVLNPGHFLGQVGAVSPLTMPYQAQKDNFPWIVLVVFLAMVTGFTIIVVVSF